MALCPGWRLLQIKIKSAFEAVSFQASGTLTAFSLLGDVSGSFGSGVR